MLLADIDLGSESPDDLSLAVNLPSAVVGVPYTGALIASGGTTPYVYDDTPAGTLPPGLTIDDTTGAVTGTPTTVGYYEFTASVTDAANDTAQRVVSIRVTSGIAISNVVPPGEVGIAYFAFFSALGGTPPYTWTVASGALEANLSMSGGGTVSGTPATAGTYNFTARATDALGNPQDLPATIVIAEALDITTSTYPDGFVGVFYNAGPTVIGGVAPISYAWTGTLPPGTNFSPSTGFVTGTPTAIGTYAFDITGTDLLGAQSTTAQSVTISTGGGFVGIGIETINTIGPDSGGDFTIGSADSTLIITPTPSGIDLSATGGGGGNSLETEILADNPNVYYKCDEASGNIIDYGSAGIDLTPGSHWAYRAGIIVPKGITPTAFANVSTTPGEAGAVGAGNPTGVSVASGSYTLLVVVRTVNTLNSADHTFFNYTDSGSGGQSVVYLTMNTGGIRAFLLSQTITFNTVTVYPSSGTLLGPLISHKTYMIHLDKNSSTKTFYLWINGILVAGGTYSTEVSSPLGTPTVYLGTSRAAEAGEVFIADTAWFYGSILSTSRKLAHARAAGLLGY